VSHSGRRTAIPGRSQSDDDATYDSCSAVAIGDKGMYAVGMAAESSGDSDAMLLKF